MGLDKGQEKRKHQMYISETTVSLEQVLLLQYNFPLLQRENVVPLIPIFLGSYSMDLLMFCDTLGI